jgi:hypothetical protein
VQLFGGEVDALAIGTVDYVYQRLGFVEVVRPQVTQLLLSAHVPHHEFNRLEVKLLYVETDGGDGAEDVTQFEGVEDGSFARTV